MKIFTILDLEFRQRLDKIRKVMRKKQLDPLLAFSTESASALFAFGHFLAALILRFGSRDEEAVSNGTKIRRILECGIGILPMFSEDHRLEADATMLILVPFGAVSMWLKVFYSIRRHPS